MGSINPLARLIASVAADQRIALIASAAAVILSVFCALLVWRQQRRLAIRLATVQTELDNLSSATRRLERDRKRLWLLSMMSRKPSGPSDALEEKMTVPALPNEEHCEEYLVAPKTSPE